MSLTKTDWETLKVAPLKGSRTEIKVSPSNNVAEFKYSGQKEIEFRVSGIDLLDSDNTFVQSKLNLYAPAAVQGTRLPGNLASDGFFTNLTYEIDGTTKVITLKKPAAPATAATAIQYNGTYSNGGILAPMSVSSFFSKCEILCGSEVLETVEAADRLSSLLDAIYVSDDALNSVGEICHAMTTRDRNIKRLTEYTAVAGELSGGYHGKYIIFPLSVLGLFQCKDYLPIFALSKGGREFTIRLTLNDPKRCLYEIPPAPLAGVAVVGHPTAGTLGTGVVAASLDYGLTEVSLIGDALRLSMVAEEVNRAMREDGHVISFGFNAWNHRTFNIPAGLSNVNYQFSTSAAEDVQLILIAFECDNLSSQDYMPTGDMNVWPSNLEEIQLFCGSNAWPTQPMKFTPGTTPPGAPHAYMNALKAFNKISYSSGFSMDMDSFTGNRQLPRTDHTNGTPYVAPYLNNFMVVFSLSSEPEEMHNYAGLGLDSRNKVFEIKQKYTGGGIPAVAGSVAAGTYNYAGPLKMHVWDLSKRSLLISEDRVVQTSAIVSGADL